MAGKRDRSSSRSAGYQWVFAEISCAIETLEGFQNEDGIGKRLSPFEFNEEIAELEEQLKTEFWKLVRTQLTPRQREVLELCAEGLTQTEIAKKLMVNQSSIVKNLKGNTLYLDDGKSISYGGSKKKLKMLIEENDKIKNILEKINKLREENWG